MPRLAAIALLVIAPLALRAAEPEGAEFFEKRVRPVLVEHCYSCHSAQAKEPKSGLRLDSRAGVLKGGARGPAIVPGDVAKSRLLHAISYSDVDLSMPARGKLPAQAIADLTTWVKMGAPWPAGDAAVAVEKKPGFDLQKRKAEHWAWQQVKPTPPTTVRDAAWPLDPVDRFILAKLEAAGLRPAHPADRATWLRRVYFDLIGLPPTPEELDAFLRDVSPGAFATVVDSLLASPHFGERWGRHWLDLVRYAETKGHEFDPIIPNAYQYRDYVIRALNADVPYNQFVTEHLAGDLLPKPRMSGPDGFNESILGTGYWFLNEEVHSPVDIRADECDRIDNKIDVFSKTFLALTVSCARCHDHKFDAISQKDYYALSGFLLSSAYRQVRFDSMEHNERVAAEVEKLRERHTAPIFKAIADSLEPAESHLKANLQAARSAIRAGKPGDTPAVRAWVKHLAGAAKDPYDPFHLWAVLATVDDSKVAEAFGRKFDEFKQQRAAYRATIDNASPILILDEGDAEWATGWNTPCGVRIVWGSTAGQPILHFRPLPEFDFEPAFSSLSTTPGTEHDHGVLGAKARYGHVLYSDTFTIEKGRVYVWAKGRGRIYAAVDSHTLIAGPLHGRLIQEFDTAGTWKWVLCDLTPYKGHRCHLEFSSREGHGLVIDEQGIVESGIAPPLKPSLTWLDPEIWGRPSSLDELAEIYGEILKFVRSSLIGPPPHLSLQATAFANCVLDHPEMFDIKDWSKAREAAKPFIEAQVKLMREFRRESRLAPAMRDGDGVDENVLLRGSHKAVGELVLRRFLEALPSSEHIEFPTIHSGRDFLARQVTDPAIDPLIARVIVNRVWHHLFGRGIVASVDNFGVMGERPTHPEMLDYLADRFVREGWSLKKLIRELVLSQTYRMASRGDGDAADPENKLLHAMRLKRLEGEAIRDSMLSLAGRLDEKMFGAPVPIYLGNIAEARGKPPVDGPLDGAGRRSVYVAVRRNFLSPFMLAFDTPAPFSTMGRRTVSNVPAQALILMNDPFVHQQAERWGRRLAAEPGDVAARVERMYESAFARRPSADELARSRAFVESRGGDARAWGDLAHVLFNVKEFIYVP
jgi:cytochrome c553